MIFFSLLKVGGSTNVIAAHLLNDKMLGNGYAHSEIEKTNTTN